MAQLSTVEKGRWILTIKEFQSLLYSQSSGKWPPQKLKKVVLHVTRAGLLRELALTSDHMVKQ